MKKLLMVAVLLFSVKAVRGEPYFKPIDISHPQITTGVFSDLKGHSDAGSSLALILHTPTDGIDWTPLAIGGTLGAGLGGPSVAMGMSANLLPEVKAAARNILTILFPAPDKFANIKTILEPAVSGTPDITMAMGPHYSLVFIDGLKTKAMFTWFIGGAWKF